MDSPIWVMPHLRPFTCLQIALTLFGIVWKTREGFPIVTPGLSQLITARTVTFGGTYGSSLVESCMGTSLQTLQENWPWFSLHFFVYVGQLVPLVVLLAHEMASYAKAIDVAKALALLGFLSYSFGFSVAMPATSLWVLRRSRKGRKAPKPSRASVELLMGVVFWLSGFTHVFAFVVAFAASTLSRDATPFHASNTLLGTPDCVTHGCAEELQRQARLRQINEMVGTSSGFFLALGLLSQALRQRGQRLGARFMARTFLVSLIAGPAAGGADVLLVRDWQSRVASAAK